MARRRGVPAYAARALRRAGGTEHTLTAKAHKLLASWLRCAEAPRNRTKIPLSSDSGFSLGDRYPSPSRISFIVTKNVAFSGAFSRAKPRPS